MKLAATRTLYGYWDRLRAGRSAPERADLEPAAIRTILGDVFLLELSARGLPSVRLAGTRVCALLGRELRGLAFADAFAPVDRADLHALIEGVAATAVPAVAGVAGETGDGRSIDLEALLLPLRHRGKTRARLLGSLAAVETPYWLGTTPLSTLRLVSVRHVLRHADPDAGRADLPIPAVRPAGGALRVLPGGKA